MPAETATAFKPNGWVAIGGDGTVTLTIGKSEMGQGVRTALAMMLADELDADWSRIKLVQASPGPGFEDLGTGGSGSMEDGWAMMRQAAAAARAMLFPRRRRGGRSSLTNAKRSVAPSCTAQQKIAYQELVADAAKLPVPKDAPLKARGDYKFIGQRTAKIDGRDIVTGHAHYGIDVKVPGMLHASVERPPWRGAKPPKMEEEKARAVRGVKSIVKTERGVAVLAENTWAAIKGRAALAVEWSEPPADAFDSEAHAKKLEAAAREKGNVTRHEEAPAGTPRDRAHDRGDLLLSVLRARAARDDELHRRMCRAIAAQSRCRRRRPIACKSRSRTC